MPHAELKYTADLELDAPALLAGIEAAILRRDPGSGDCKGRAFRVEAFHHTHLIAEISMLAKPHRDAAFIDALKTDIAALLREHLPGGCWLSVNLATSGRAT